MQASQTTEFYGCLLTKKTERRATTNNQELEVLLNRKSHMRKCMLNNVTKGCQEVKKRMTKHDVVRNAKTSGALAVEFTSTTLSLY
jgi:hypothetical protein